MKKENEILKWLNGELSSKEIEDLKQSGINNEEVLTILLITQHYDALEAMSKNAHSNTIMVPYSSSNVSNMREQIQEAILTTQSSNKNLPS